MVPLYSSRQPKVFGMQAVSAPTGVLILPHRNFRCLSVLPHGHLAASKAYLRKSFCHYKEK